MLTLLAGSAEENLQVATAAFGFGKLHFFQQCVWVWTLIVHGGVG